MKIRTIINIIGFSCVVLGLRRLCADDTFTYWLIAAGIILQLLSEADYGK